MDRELGRMVRQAGTLARMGAAALALPLVMGWSHPSRHPIHSTLTEITYDAPGRQATLRVRAFADDFEAATARWSAGRKMAAGAGRESTSFAYLAHTISLETAAGAPVRLEWCGVERSGEVLWLCLRGALPGGLIGAHVANRCLTDLYDDEINIVQTEYAGRRSSLLFTKGDGPKVVMR